MIAIDGSMGPLNAAQNVPNAITEKDSGSVLKRNALIQAFVFVLND